MRTKIILAVFALIFAACGGEAGTEEAAPAASAGDETAAPAEAPAPAANAAEAGPPMPTTAGLIIHEVADYAKWKEGFDAHADARKAAGLVGHAVSRSSDNPNQVGVYLAATDIEKVKGFLADPKLKEAMAAAGVKGEPKIIMMNHTDLKPYQGEGVAAEIMVSHEVEDYDKWKVAFDRDDAKRREAGLLGYGVSRDADNPNLVHVWAQVSDVEKARAMLGSEDLKKVMAEAGVKGKPTITFQTPVETVFYQ